MSYMKRILWLFLLVCTGLAVLFGCGEEKPLSVGFVGPLEGKLSDLGVQGRNGVQLALEQVNDRGGINGRRLELLPVDDANSAQRAAAAVRSLAEEDVVAIIGHMTSQMTMVGYQVAEAEGIPMISPTTSTASLSGKKDLFFRVLPVSTEWAEGLADYATEQGDRTVVSVCDLDNRAYTVPFLDAFKKVFGEKGGTVLHRVEYHSSEPVDWDELAREIKRLEPDCLMVGMSARDLASLARAQKSIGGNARIYSAMWAYTRELLVAGGRSVNGITFAVGYTEDNTSSAYREFRETYMKRFGWEPNFAAALSYEAAMLLIEGLMETNGSRQGLAEALVNLHGMQGVIGDYILDEYGDVVRQSYIVTIRNGSFETVTSIGN